ncbi:MAG TPA: nucleoid-associated protein, partial [Bacillota bacterium]|nr:nucleoid-associated protein [Bacillota bacterium]
MGILIKKAVLHILDPNVGVPVLSHQELELSDEVYFFLEKVIDRFFEDENAKEAEFTGEVTRLPELCQELTRGLDFVAGSVEVANLFFAIMQANPDIVPADLICALFSKDDEPYFGMFKFNYRTGYIHNVNSDTETCVNTLIKQKTVLPSETQRLEEAAVVHLVNLSIRMVEKEYEINGAKDCYLSKLILGCSGRLSNNQKARVIEKVTQKISKKYYDDNFEQIARMRK